MKRLMMAVLAAVSFLLVGQGMLRAGGQPQANTRQSAGAVPGQQYGTSADVAAKQRLDAQKYQKPATGARHEPPSSDQKQ